MINMPLHDIGHNQRMFLDGRLAGSGTPYSLLTIVIDNSLSSDLSFFVHLQT